MVNMPQSVIHAEFDLRQWLWAVAEYLCMRHTTALFTNKEFFTEYASANSFWLLSAKTTP